MCIISFLQYLRDKLFPIKENPFENLPGEIVVDILSRLPIQTIMGCKQVCKPWREVIGGYEFAMSHLSKSASAPNNSCLVLVEDMGSSKPYKICAFDDGTGSCATTVSRFSFPPILPPEYEKELIPYTSDHGVILLWAKVMFLHCRLVLCNPITRVYCELPPVPIRMYHSSVFGFGTSKVSGEYKVVMISKEFYHSEPMYELYTLGTDPSWKSLNPNPSPSRRRTTYGDGVTLNGNLHWLERDGNNPYHPSICCFDLETELFSSFSAPAVRRGRLSSLEGRLCLSDNTSKDEMSLWFMNTYRDVNSWAKEVTVEIPPVYREIGGYFYPIKVFEDGGDILFAKEMCDQLFLYSNKTKAIQEYGPLRLCSRCPNVIVFTPNFYAN